MTIEQLIKKLKKYPPSIRVFFAGEYCCGEIEVVYEQPAHSDFDRKKSSIVLSNDRLY